MKILLILFLPFFISCNKNDILLPEQTLSLGNNIKLAKNKRAFEILLISIIDQRCIVNSNFSVNHTLPAEVKLKVLDKTCSGSACEQEITLLNYECAGSDLTYKNKIFSSESKESGFYSESFGLKIGLLRISPEQTINPNTHLNEKIDLGKYKLTLIIQ